MTLNEAIAHAQEVADSMRRECPTHACGLEHQQLADWLRELRDRREKDRRDSWSGFCAFAVLCATFGWVAWLMMGR